MYLLGCSVLRINSNNLLFLSPHLKRVRYFTTNVYFVYFSNDFFICYGDIPLDCFGIALDLPQLITPKILVKISQTF